MAPGDVIHVDDSEDGSSGFLRGHGTYVLNENKLVASVAGVVERVNKLISVRPLKSRLEHDFMCLKKESLTQNKMTSIWIICQVCCRDWGCCGGSHNRGRTEEVEGRLEWAPRCPVNAVGHKPCRRRAKKKNT